MIRNIKNPDSNNFNYPFIILDETYEIKIVQERGNQIIKTILKNVEKCCYSKSKRRYSFYGKEKRVYSDLKQLLEIKRNIYIVPIDRIISISKKVIRRPVA